MHDRNLPVQPSWLRLAATRAKVLPLASVGAQERLSAARALATLHFSNRRPSGVTVALAALRQPRLITYCRARISLVWPPHRPLQLPSSLQGSEAGLWWLCWLRQTHRAACSLQPIRAAQLLFQRVRSAQGFTGAACCSSAFSHQVQASHTYQFGAILA